MWDVTDVSEHASKKEVAIETKKALIGLPTADYSTIGCKQRTRLTVRNC